MKTRSIVSAAALLTLIGCAALQPQQPASPLAPANFTEAAQPQVNIPPDPLADLPPALRDAYLQKSDRPVQDGFVTFYPYREYQEPVVHCAAGHVTEIVLSPNEHVTAATVGDSLRWTLLTERNRVRVKPCPAGCNATTIGAAAGQTMALQMPTVFATNLIVDTDQRTYHLKLQAGSLAHANESVAFWYPDEITDAQTARAAALRKAAQQAADPPARLNFNYRITGPEVSWKPVEAFDDGAHEYLLFANAAALKDDMPTLYVQRDQTQELVNYQARGDYYIVDRLYSDAALTEGVGTDRQTVHIEALGAH
jgi:P-type conjugative transfer protein TrbG